MHLILKCPNSWDKENSLNASDKITNCRQKIKLETREWYYTFQQWHWKAEEKGTLYFKGRLFII
jgi:hypothetical protein